MGLALLAKASMPLYYWDEAFCISVYLINRLFTPNRARLWLRFCLKYLLLFLLSKHLATHVISTSEVLIDINFRSIECILIGYSLNHKGYKCLDPMEGSSLPKMSSLMKIHSLCQKSVTVDSIIHSMRLLHS